MAPPAPSRQAYAALAAHGVAGKRGGAMSSAESPLGAVNMAATTLYVSDPIEAAVEAVGPGAESTTVNVTVENDPAVVRDALMARGVACGPLGQSPGYVSFLMRDLDGHRFSVTRVHSSAQASVGRAIEESSA
jgi:hypothetical protein